MRIRNINGTSDNSCRCESWLKHWERYSGQRTNYCQANGCLKTDVVGAHVQKENSTDNNWYIYPLCNAHNQRASSSLEVRDSYNLVSANVSQTCGR